MTTPANSGKEGAASAAPSLPELADLIRDELAEIDRGQSTALAHAIQAGELLTQAKSQVDHGEWLPWLEKNFELTVWTAQAYMRLGANAGRVSHLSSVREALAVLNPRKPKKPKDSILKGKAGLSHDPEVIDWVRAKTKKGWIRDQIVEASEQGADGWPRKDGALTNGGVSECRAVIAMLERTEGSGAPRRRSGATAKLKQYGIERKKDSGKLWDLRYKLMKIVGWLAQLDLLAWGIDEGDADLVYDLYDDLVLLDEWTTAALVRASAYIDDDGIREKIRKMQENQSGRTDAEKENIKRRVRALERRLENKLAA